jgi:putative PIN family toxin of toxin-antitoxin system
MSRRVVLDTNCLLASISRRSRRHRVWQSFVAGDYDLCVTTEILAEYEEIIGRLVSPFAANLVIEAILRAPNTVRIEASFRFGLITADPDDNKFVDCAFKSGARYIVTQDHHYDVLRQIEFPLIEVIGIDKFLRLWA